MTDTQLKLVLQTGTNLVFGSFIAAGWLLGKVDAAVALFPLLALAGLDVMGRRVERQADARAAADPSLPQATGSPVRVPPLPPPGPTAAVLLMALEAVRNLIA